MKHLNDPKREPSFRKALTERLVWMISLYRAFAPVIIALIGGILLIVILQYILR